MIIQSLFLLTVSNSLVRSTNTTYSPLFCFLHFSVWGWIPCQWCPCWLWTHTGFLIGGLQRWWVPICLGVHEQGLFRWWRVEWSPDNWSNLTFLSCFCIMWQWLHRGDHLEVCPAPNNKQKVHEAYCVMLVFLFSRALVESCWLPLPYHSSNTLWLC